MSKEAKRPERLTDMKEVSKLARTFMKGWDSGVLNTQFEQNGDEFPFGSLTPFVLTEEGEITILISDLAIHTKNILRNKKVGFTVFDMEASHKQAAARVSLTGFASLLDEKEDEERYKRVSERYFTFFPMARNYFKAHNFFFYTLKPKHVHFIKTFGQIYSFDAEDNWNLTTPEWIGSENGAIEHMNKDHKDALMKFSKDLIETDTQEVSLICVDGEGFHMKIDEKIHYMNFLADASDAKGLHREFVNLARS
jgi:putative heme iron utilization protein